MHLSKYQGHKKWRKASKRTVFLFQVTPKPSVTTTRRDSESSSESTSTRAEKSPELTLNIVSDLDWRGSTLVVPDLLEKSRVIKQAPGERSYHIFYQIYSDAVKGLREKLFLTRPIKEYTFVSQAEVTIDGVDDKEEMMITDEAFDIMKFTETEKSELFAITAGIMHMGELKFKQRPREEQAELEDGKGK